MRRVQQLRPPLRNQLGVAGKSERAGDETSRDSAKNAQGLGKGGEAERGENAPGPNSFRPCCSPSMLHRLMTESRVLETMYEAPVAPLSTSRATIPSVFGWTMVWVGRVEFDGSLHTDALSQLPILSRQRKD
jgi:hypothetical protein